MTKSDWKKCKLGDIVTIKHGFAFKGDFITETPSSSILVTPGNFKIGGGFKYTKLKYYANGPIPKEYILNTGDLIVTMTDLSKTGDTLGYSALVPAIPGKILLHNQRIGLISIQNEKVSKNFIYWLMRCDEYQRYIVNTSSGSTVKHTSPSRIMEFAFFLPPLEEQKRIADILGALDDKIELLQKQNKTLEDMAKAIFKSWFMDFDVVHAKQKGLPKADIMREYHLTEELYDLFPSDFENSSLGPIPSGWEVKTIQDLGEVVCGKTPSTSHKEYYGGSMPFITIPDMHNSIFANKTERYLTSQGEQAQPTKTLPPFSVCVSCIATPGLVTMTTTNSQTNQQINSVIPHNLEAKFYNYYVLLSVADQIRAQGSGGSVFVNLNKTAFSKIKVLWADQTLQKLFTKESEIYFDKILNNLKQIQTLTELRDTLLPHLISGKLRV